MSTATAPPQEPDVAAESHRGWPAEQRVLSHLLDQLPRRLTLGELAREIDGVELTAQRRAVENLAAARFLRQEGARLVLAPAVAAFDRGAV